MKKFRITINGRTYEVEAEVVSDSSPAAAPAASASVGAGSTPVPVATPKAASLASGAGDIISPLAGKVVSVDVKIGASVKTGDKLITLEAMKMNTFVNAPADGVLKEISVTPGQAVAEGDLLGKIA